MTERVLICGDREFGDRAAMRRFIASLPDGTVVIHGAARGADRLAGEEASARGLEVVEFPADWRRYRAGAGPIRNQRMLDEGRPTRVAFAHRDLARSRGTADMVRRAVAAGFTPEAIV